MMENWKQWASEFLVVLKDEDQGERAAKLKELEVALQTEAVLSGPAPGRPERPPGSGGGGAGQRRGARCAAEPIEPCADAPEELARQAATGPRLVAGRRDSEWVDAVLSAGEVALLSGQGGGSAKATCPCNGRWLSVHFQRPGEKPSSGCATLSVYFCTNRVGTLVSACFLGGTMRNMQYQVALSFAGEQRSYVEKVARNLQARSIVVFYDDFEKISLWGENAAEAFDKAFAQQANYVVMFISQAYVAKAWPRHERRVALSRAVQEPGEYILPVRASAGTPSGRTAIACRRRGAVVPFASL